MATPSKRPRNDEEPPAMSRKRMRFSFCNVITVVAGRKGGDKGPETFIVHKDLLCSSSDFFKTATSREELNPEEKAIEVPELPAPYFRVYSEWLYNPGTPLTDAAQTALSESTGKDVSSMSQHSKKCMAVSGLIWLWDAGDLLGDVTFKNAVMLALLGIDSTFGTGRGVTVSTISWSAHPCLAGSAIQRWIIDYAADCMTSDMVDKAGQKWPVQFYQELLKKMLDQRVPGRLTSSPNVNDFSKYEETQAMQEERAARNARAKQEAKEQSPNNTQGLTPEVEAKNDKKAGENAQLKSEDKEQDQENKLENP